MYHPASFHAPHVSHNSQYGVPSLSPPNSSVAYASRRSSTVTSADVEAASDIPPLRIIDQKKQRIHDQLYRSGSVINNFPIKQQSTSPVAISKSSPTEESNESHYNTSGSQYDVKYISSSCVLVTYYSGDVTSVVDDHFSKALNHTPADSASVPMSQRSLPASFWDSSLSPSCSNSSSSTGGCIAGPSSSGSYSRHQFYPTAANDSYHHTVSLAAGLSQPTAEWYYHTHPHQHAIAAGHHQGYGHPHASAAGASSTAGSSAAVAAVQQNLAYGAAAAAAASRYNQYPSLLLQSAAAGRLGMQQSSTLDPASYSPYMYPTGLEGTTVGESAAKDLYWFQ